MIYNTSTRNKKNFHLIASLSLDSSANLLNKININYLYFNSKWIYNNHHFLGGAFGGAVLAAGGGVGALAGEAGGLGGVLPAAGGGGGVFPAAGGGGTAGAQALGDKAMGALPSACSPQCPAAAAAASVMVIAVGGKPMGALQVKHFVNKTLNPKP